MSATTETGHDLGETRHAATSPFIRYRQRLDSYAEARHRGWTDARFVATVETLDRAVADVVGSGFLTTPLREEVSLARALGLGERPLWIKDDTGNVSGSHKARHLFGVALRHLVDEEPIAELAIASCGNAALAAAVVARAAGHPLRVFIPTWADPRVVTELRALQATVVVCERRAGEVGDPTYLRFVEAVDDGATPFSCQSTMTPAALDGGRTIGWELADQLVERVHEGPLRLYVQVGGGALASSLWLGIVDGLDAHLDRFRPTLHPVQTEACAPLARAWRALEQAEPDDAAARIALARGTPERFMSAWQEVGTSAASGILDDVTYDWLTIVDALSGSGSQPIVVSEQQVLAAHRALHAHTAIDADATGSAGLAGVIDDVEHARVDDDAELVVLATGVTRR